MSVKPYRDRKADWRQYPARILECCWKVQGGFTLFPGIWDKKNCEQNAHSANPPGLIHRDFEFSLRQSHSTKWNVHKTKLFQKLQWIHGLNENTPIINMNGDNRNQVFYAAAYNGVLYDYITKKMNFLQGHVSIKFELRLMGRNQGLSSRMWLLFWIFVKIAYNKIFACISLPDFNPTTPGPRAKVLTSLAWELGCLRLLFPTFL